MSRIHGKIDDYIKFLIKSSVSPPKDARKDMVYFFVCQSKIALEKCWKKTRILYICHFSNFSSFRFLTKGYTCDRFKTMFFTFSEFLDFLFLALESGNICRQFRDNSMKKCWLKPVTTQNLVQPQSVGLKFFPYRTAYGSL